MRFSKTLPPELRKIDPEDAKQWEAVAQAITSRLDDENLHRVRKQAERAASPAAKVMYLRKLADTLGAAAAPHVPCKDGCSGCCHMSVIMSEIEATQIAKATGAKMRKGAVRYVAEGDERYSGHACSFLVNNKCSIYENRPYACRVYFVVHRDNSKCQIVPGVPAMAPSIDLNAYHLAYGAAFGEKVAEGLADIREFFPDGLGRRNK